MKNLFENWRRYLNPPDEQDRREISRVADKIPIENVPDEEDEELLDVDPGEEESLTET